MSDVNDLDYSIKDYAFRASASVSIYADRVGLRNEIAQDLNEAGFQLEFSAGLDALLENCQALSGDVVLLDVPTVDARLLAALSEIDMCISASATRLVVSTTIDALDDIFACMDQSSPQILIAPSRAERVVALGRLIGEIPGHHVNDLSHEDRITLLRLSEQVDQIAKRLEGLESEGGPQLSEHKSAFFGFENPEQGAMPARPSLPDPRMVREIIRRRQARARFFDSELFADPAWDMLLDLTAADAEHRRVSVTSLCIASGVPTTTALRWVRELTKAGVFERVKDTTDKRRAFISLSDRSREAMANYFASISESTVAYAA